ncbi:hypothetical protein [Pseudomonas sp. TH10]|uniref:hypothetical protein n=1 Tax=Pseudomonas sp. TH10 TaxID=2796376 RepID=UPI0019137189|nr:hypothetical protein [Pseudomonas sp. TH10]MBK5516416.1 hypothetical protein [Pseudomonas sp. TH10]
MNAGQKTLVEKTLGIVGWVSATILGLILLAGFVDKGRRFLPDIFDSEEMAPIVWPLFLVAATLLWMRAYMRAGRK